MPETLAKRPGFKAGVVVPPNRAEQVDELARLDKPQPAVVGGVQAGQPHRGALTPERVVVAGQ